MRALLAGVLALAMWSAAAIAAPVEPAQRDSMLAIYTAFNKAVAAGKLDDALALRSADRRARILVDAKTAAQRKNVLELLKSMIPDAIEVQRAVQSKDGSKITLNTLVTMVVPANAPRRAGVPPPGTKLQAELALDFLRERNVWKFDNQTWGMDPSKVKPCNATWGGMDAFEERDNLSMGGQIRRVDFGPDHTKVVIRMFDEENCIFLPSRARLTELGFNPDWIEPWAIIEIEAWPHRDDKQAVWAARVTIRDEE